MRYSDNNLDKFFTKPEVARFCYDIVCDVIPENFRKCFIEPSAGSGAFLDFLPDYIAFDIDPMSDNIIKADFLSIETKEFEDKKI